jgi:hypothetical protein
MCRRHQRTSDVLFGWPSRRRLALHNILVTALLQHLWRSMQPQIPARVFPLPGFDQEERDRAGRVNGKARDAPVDPRIAAFASMRVAAMRAQRADAFHR